MGIFGKLFGKSDKSSIKRSRIVRLDYYESLKEQSPTRKKRLDEAEEQMRKGTALHMQGKEKSDPQLLWDAAEAYQKAYTIFMCDDSSDHKTFTLIYNIVTATREILQMTENANFVEPGNVACAELMQNKFLDKVDVRVSANVFYNVGVIIYYDAKLNSDASKYDQARKCLKNAADLFREAGIDRMVRLCDQIIQQCT